MIKDKRVLESWREPDGLCVVTAYGYAFVPDDDHNCAEHFHIYDNQQQALKAIREGGKCTCLRCKSLGKRCVIG